MKDEFLKVMFSIGEFRCLYDEKLKDDKEQRKMTAWKEIIERVGIPVESCIRRHNIQNFLLVIHLLGSFPRCCFVFRTSNKKKTFH